MKMYKQNQFSSFCDSDFESQPPWVKRHCVETERSYSEEESFVDQRGRSCTPLLEVVEPGRKGVRLPEAWPLVADDYIEGLVEEDVDHFVSNGDASAEHPTEVRALVYSYGRGRRSLNSRHNTHHRPL